MFIHDYLTLRKYNTYLLVLGVLLFSSKLVWAQKPTEDAAIQASKEWSAAFYAGDTQKLNNLELGGLVIVGGGKIWEKTQPRDAAFLPSSEEEPTKDITHVKLNNNTALLVGRLNGENPKSTLVSETWVWQTNQWKIASAHFSSAE